MKPKRIRITCKVHSGKKIEEIHIDELGVFHIHIKEIREKGRANKRIIQLLASYYKVPQYYVTLISGFTTTIKQIEIIFPEKDY